MATLTIRNLDDDVRARLRRRAAEHGRSTEAEVRAILGAAVSDEPREVGVASRIAALFADVETDSPITAPRNDLARATEF